MVEVRPKNLGLCYGQSYEESPKEAMKEEGVHQHALEQESGESSKTIEGIDSVPKGAYSSFDSPPC